MLGQGKAGSFPASRGRVKGRFAGATVHEGAGAGPTPRAKPSYLVSTVAFMADMRGAHWTGASIALGLTAVAVAIGFDDATLSNYQLKVARLLVSAGGALGVIVSALRYVWERQRELAWQKTTFMVGLFKDFEQDKTLRRAQELVDRSRYDDADLRAALEPLDTLYKNAASARARAGARLGPGREPREALADRLALDRYLDFFDHLYTYIFLTRTLEAADVTSFSGYAIDILDSELLADAAREWGYGDVLRLAIHFLDLSAKRDDVERDAQLKATVERMRETPVG